MFVCMPLCGVCVAVFASACVFQALFKKKFLQKFPLWQLLKYWKLENSKGTPEKSFAAWQFIFKISLTWKKKHNIIFFPKMKNIKKW